VSLLLASLFPPDVVTLAATAADEDESLLTADEAAWLAPMVPARRREFAAGRNAARRALTRLGVAPTGIGRRLEDRDPIWPPGVIGSISHSHGAAAVAVARAGALASLGLDIERSAPLGDELVREVCRDEELAQLRHLPPPAPADWPMLLFCIKEAAYKAWFPLTREPLEFHHMQVLLQPESRRFTARVRHAAFAGLALEGRYGWSEAIVVAGAVGRARRTV
jgi:4'-phosphopantetheinyl transferase EntD